MALSNEALKNLLVKGGVLSDAEFGDIEREAQRTGIPPVRLLISRGRLSQKYLNELVSSFLNIPLFDLWSKPLVMDTVELLPEAIARQRQVLVFDHDPKKDAYSVAMADPTDVESLNFLKEYLKGDIVPHIATPEDLRFGYRVYKKKSSEEFEKVIAEKVREVRTSLSRTGESIFESVPLVQLFDTVIDYAAILGASDVYFQPEEDSLKIRFRIDGLLRDVLSLDAAIKDSIVARVKILSNLRIDEHQKPQDGRFRFRSSDIDLDIRSAVMPTFFGEKITLRLLAGARSFLTFTEIGMNDDVIGKLQKAIERPYGMFLSTGPTGSGKTTTIYSILGRLNRPEVHIMTIEDPVEYLIPNVSQTQVNVQAEITFASGLRSLLRHNPDIIFIGEIRDRETADIAVNAALTGHLLISTLHTNDAPGAVVRLMNLGIPPFLISATMNAILAQRLVRRVCRNCIESYKPPAAALKKLQDEIPPGSKKMTMPTVFYHGKGCSVCGNTGYEGRIGIFEIFLIDEKVRTLITTKTVTIDDLEQAAKAQGMQTMFEDGLTKTTMGITTIEEVLRAVRE
jgi:type IV pilus assembly protein PilB